MEHMDILVILDIVTDPILNAGQAIASKISLDL